MPPKEFWKASKLLNKQDSCIRTLSHNGKTVETNCDKALVLNTFLPACACAAGVSDRSCPSVVVDATEINSSSVLGIDGSCKYVEEDEKPTS